MPIKISDPTSSEQICENSDAFIDIALTDADGSPIPGSSIASAIYTLTVNGTHTVINSRQDVNLLPLITEEGVATIHLLPADNVIVSTAEALTREFHLLTISITTSGASPITKHEEIAFPVYNLQQIS